MSTITASVPATRANRYGGRCGICNGYVPAGEGMLTGSRGAWGVGHLPGACPAPAAGTPAAPAASAAPGYYVRADGTAVQVIASKSNPGRTYGKVLNVPADGGRPSWDYVPGAGWSVAELTPMTGEAAARMGLASGYCVKCCAPLGGDPGKVATLSSQVAALIGYGATCAARMGWSFPHGAAAQRAFIAAHR